MGENRLMADLYAENERLKARISELESKHFVECTIISQYDDELKEAKRLLKSARSIIEDVICNEDYLCNECEYRAKCDGGFSFYWRYEAEALALIGEGTNAPAREDGAENG